jgi:hypothetical protein
MIPHRARPRPTHPPPHTEPATLVARRILSPPGSTPLSGAENPGRTPRTRGGPGFSAERGLTRATPRSCGEGGGRASSRDLNTIAKPRGRAGAEPAGLPVSLPPAPSGSPTHPPSFLSLPPPMAKDDGAWEYGERPARSCSFVTFVVHPRSRAEARGSARDEGSGGEGRSALFRARAFGR